MALEEIPLPPPAPAAAPAEAERVRTLAALAVPDAEIAAALGLTERELAERHGREIAMARAMARARVGQALFKRATEGSGRDADNAAREFYALTGGRLGAEAPRVAEPSPAPVAPAPAGVTCNFEEMADKLGISKPTLREWISRYEEFPVLARGSNGIAWRFDPGEVIAFVTRKREEEAAADAQRMELLGQMPLPFEAPADGTARGVDLAEMGQLYKLARAADELALSRGQLLRVADVREPLAEMIARLRSSALSLPRRWGTRHNLPAPVVAELKRDLEEWLTEMHAGFRQHLTAAAVPDLEPMPDDEAPAAAA
jgi:phage terminase Nu1 subunit (DNA packaging protein)